jgi:dipeptidyl aminopeptidase/acylaminoacyl peptidase
MFVSERTTADANGVAPCGGGDMYLSRQSPAGGWSAPVNLGCAPNGPNFAGAERSPSVVETWYGTFLFYSSTGTSGNHDIYVSRLGANGQFGAGRIVERLSSADADLMPNARVRWDGSVELVFSSNRATWGSSEPAFGGQDVYTAVSWFLPQQWTLPRNLGSNVNTAGDEQRATLSADGDRLYFGRSSTGVPSDIYVSER